MKPSRAIVIGASMAGLITARVLSDFCGQVVVLERDEPGDMPAPRKGVPQGRHLHALLASGRDRLDHYFTGLTDELVRGGALSGDPGLKTRWHLDGDYRSPTALGRASVLVSRPLIETVVRRRVGQLANVTLLTGADVKGLLASPDKTRVLGVRLERRTPLGALEADELPADLVVDCAGRGSATPKWLTALGYPRPAEDAIQVDLAYATRTYRRRPEQGDMALFITPAPPHEVRGGGMFPVDGERWILTLAGYFGDHPPTDEHGFNEFARSLGAPDIYNLAKDSEPLTDIVSYKYPASLRRRYERLTRHPEGLLVLGDALCSFNPVYGQGMTSAILQAQALGAQLTQNPGRMDGLWRRFYAAAARVVAHPWQLAAGADLAYPQAQGARPAGVALINRYMAHLQRATHTDTVVHAAFLASVNLLQPPASLFAPAILFRVWRAARGRPGQRSQRAAAFSSVSAGR